MVCVPFCFTRRIAPVSEKLVKPDTQRFQPLIKMSLPQIPDTKIIWPGTKVNAAGVRKSEPKRVPVASPAHADIVLLVPPGAQKFLYSACVPAGLHFNRARRLSVDNLLKACLRRIR